MVNPPGSPSNVNISNYGVLHESTSSVFWASQGSVRPATYVHIKDGVASTTHDPSMKSNLGEIIEVARNILNDPTINPEVKNLVFNDTLGQAKYVFGLSGNEMRPKVNPKEDEEVVKTQKQDIRDIRAFIREALKNHHFMLNI